MNSRNSKNHQIEAVSGGCWGKVTKQRGTRFSCVTTNKNPTKKYLQNSTTKFPRKGYENHEKGKMGETTKALRNHAESSIHTKKGSYKV
jgi:hypothetical protein